MQNMSGKKPSPSSQQANTIGYNVKNILRSTWGLRGLMFSVICREPIFRGAEIAAAPRHFCGLTNVLQLAFPLESLIIHKNQVI